MEELHLDRIVRTLKLGSTFMAFGALILSVSIYAAVSHYNHMDRMRVHANHIADSVSRFAYAHPETWRFQEHRLHDQVWRAIPRGYDLYVELSDQDEGVLLTLGSTSHWPHWQRSAAVTDGYREIAMVRVSKSMEETIYNGGFVLSAAALLSILLLLLIRALPLRAVALALERVEQAHDQLQQKIVHKDQTLARVAHTAMKLKKSADTDGLTGLLNRHAFFNTLERRISEMDEETLSFCLFMGDLDGFKGVNDNLGHAKGDEVLKKVSAALTSNTRRSDLVARYGGDEFILCLFSTTQDETLHIARHLCEKIAAVGQSALPKELKMGISLGISCYPAHHQDIQHLLRLADEAMYQAKQQQRCYVFHGGSDI